MGWALLQLLGTQLYEGGKHLVEHWSTHHIPVWSGSSLRNTLTFSIQEPFVPQKQGAEFTDCVVVIVEGMLQASSA